ncbi:MAG: LPS assembly lipoprotein LptE [Candidatus Omnitrophota bacterium]
MKSNFSFPYSLLLLLFGLWLLALVFASGGCGYATTGYIYNEKKIFITPVTNEVDITSEARKYSEYRSFPVLLEKKLTNTLIDKFNTYGRLKVVSQEAGALKLGCTVKDYRKEALRYTDGDEVNEQRLWLDVYIVLTDSKGVVLKEGTESGKASYFLSGPQSKSESAAQKDLIDDTARRIQEAVVEEW